MNRDRFSGAGRLPRYLFSATKFLIFFALIAFVVTCSFLLFLDSMRLDPDILRENALLTFLNILLLSALFTVIDGIRRRLTVERPVRRIRAATQRIIQGDFSVHIEPLHGPERADAFDAIIEDFNQMARELSGVETLRTDFIANVSHELKRRWPSSRTTVPCCRTLPCRKSSASNMPRPSQMHPAAWRT